MKAVGNAQWNSILMGLFSVATIGPLVAGAYYYYKEEYEERRKKILYPIKFMNHLEQKSEKCESHRQLNWCYKEMSKHISKFITDPSSRNSFVVDSQSQRIDEGNKEDNFLFSRLKLIKQIRVTPYSSIKQNKEGSFSLGLWLDSSLTLFNKINSSEEFQIIVDRIVERRRMRCKQIAECSSLKKERAFMEIYDECIGATNQNIAVLSRQLEFIKGFQKHQLEE